MSDKQTSAVSSTKTVYKRPSQAKEIWRRFKKTKGAVIGMILLIISISLIFNPALLGFLSEITLFLAGIILIIAGVVSLINNRASKNGFYIGIAGIILGVCYIIIGTYVANPIILGTLIGLWLLISGVMRLLN